MRLLLFVPLAGGLLACAGQQIRSSPTTDPIVVASYNIRHGRGNDDQLNLDRTAKALRLLDADIIGLQEVDDEVNRSGNIPEAAFLGERLGMQQAFGEFFPYDGGRYGMAVLSRFPIVAARTIDLPEGEEPRTALAVSVVLPGADTLTVVNVHFDWLADDSDRFRQARVLAGELEKLDHPWILLGDFNDLPDSRTLGLFYPLVGDARKSVGARMSFPSSEPIKEIDYIFAKRDSRLLLHRIEVVVDTITSDHRPVRAVLTRGSINLPE